MVSISRKRIKRQRNHQRQISKRLGAFALAAVGSLFFVYVAVLTTTTTLGSNPTNSSIGFGLQSRRMRWKTHPDLRVSDPDGGDESYNAIALDILLTLDCVTLLNRTSDHYVLNYNKNVPAAGTAAAAAADKEAHRKLQEQGEAYHEEDVNVGDFGMDDFNMGDGTKHDWNSYGVTPTAAHLLCMAAMAGSSDEDEYNGLVSRWAKSVSCPVVEKAASSETSGVHRSLQLQLLQIWSKARADMPTEILLKTLQASTEHTRVLLDRNLHLWAPSIDKSFEYMINVLNDPDRTADNGGIRGLQNNLGASKLFVDVGSCLGLTSMAIRMMYPGTKIVSIEAASPNWLLQQVNWKCNAAQLAGNFAEVSDSSRALSQDNDTTVILGGVGAETGGMAKFMWRPQSTTSTRSWTPASERSDSDVELTVKLKPWHMLLAEAEIQHVPVDVLNMDCQGCEYNLIPSLTEEDYASISTVLGSVHWGYMPEHKLPSSKRGAKTHERLCKHENFARTVKECCAFPDLEVISSVPGEVLVQDAKQWPPKSSTIRDVAGALCDNFDAWAKEHHLYDIDTDWGWFQISAMAD